jgi:hypothetical protein
VNFDDFSRHSLSQTYSVNKSLKFGAKVIIYRDERYEPFIGEDKYKTGVRRIIESSATALLGRDVGCLTPTGGGCYRAVLVGKYPFMRDSAEGAENEYGEGYEARNSFH